MGCRVSVLQQSIQQTQAKPKLARLSLLEAEIGYFSQEVDRRGA
jgi:hypothetical protein